MINKCNYRKKPRPIRCNVKWLANGMWQQCKLELNHAGVHVNQSGMTQRRPK